MDTEQLNDEITKWKELLVRGTATAFWAGISASVMVLFSHHARLADMERWVSEHSKAKAEWVYNHERADDARSAAFADAINKNADEIHDLQRRQSEQRSRLSRCEALIEDR